MPRKHKKISECPEDLLRIIELVNLLPLNAEEYLDKLCEGNLIITDNRGDVIPNVTGGLFDNYLIERLVGYELHHISIIELRSRFNELFTARDLFRHFAELNKQFPKWEIVLRDMRRYAEFRSQFLSFTQDKQYISLNRFGFFERYGIGIGCQPRR